MIIIVILVLYFTLPWSNMAQDCGVQTQIIIRFLTSLLP